LERIPDFAVVGAGINGLLVARSLLQQGVSVTLLDKGEVARESSWAGGGIVSPLYPWRYAPAITALANWAQDYYPLLAHELLEETGLDVELSNSGLLMLDAQDKEIALAWATSEQREMEEWRPEKIYLAERELAEKFNHALWMPRVDNVRNPRLCRALLASLSKISGFTLLTNTEVDSLQTDRAGICSLVIRDVRTGKMKWLKAGTIALTVGAWTQELLKPLSVNADIKPVKGQMLLYKLAKPLIKSIVLFQGKYLIPRLDGHLLVGSTLEHVGFDKTVTDIARESLRDAAVTMVPALSSLRPVKQWAGLRPGSEGGVPMIGRAERFENLYLNAGHFRNGLVLAPASARLLTELMLGRETFIDPLPYRPR
jgi:glycine oxidase